MSIKQKIEDNIVVTIVAFTITGFSAGYKFCYEKLQHPTHDLVPKGTYILRDDIESKGFVQKAILEQLKVECNEVRANFEALRAAKADLQSTVTRLSKTQSQTECPKPINELEASKTSAPSSQLLPPFVAWRRFQWQNSVEACKVKAAEISVKRGLGMNSNASGAGTFFSGGPITALFVCEDKMVLVAGSSADQVASLTSELDLAMSN